MRPTTIFSFLAASIAVFSPVYAAPVAEVGSAVTKRGCTDGQCKNAVVPPTSSNNSPNSQSVSDLVAALIDTLSTFQNGVPTASNTTNTTINVAEPPAPVPTKSLADIVAGAL